MEDWPNIRVEEVLLEEAIWEWNADFSDRSIIDSDFSGSHLWGGGFFGIVFKGHRFF